MSEILISGNQTGIWITGLPATNNLVQGNFIVWT